MTRTSAADSGASAVEYSILIAAIAAVIVVAVYAIGTATRANYQDTCDSLASAQGKTC